MKRKSILSLIVVAVCCLGGQALAREVHVSAAASLTDALKEIIGIYNQTHPETIIRTNFGASGALAKQVEQGAPTDIFISANQKWMAHLVAGKQIDQGQMVNFVNNELVFIGPPDCPARSLDALPRLSRIALGSPKSVPAGEYAASALDKAGIWQILEKENKLIIAKDVRQALFYADRGEADGAFVYRTDALLAEKAKILFTVPTTEPISYPMAVTTAGQKNSEAVALAAFFRGEESAGIVKKYGFIPAGINR